MRSVAILGCGPAGLLVAHAAVLRGWDFQVYSKKRKSELFGAQYLHGPIPGVTPQESIAGAVVKYHLTGTPEQYRTKVYGEDWDGTVSPEDFQVDHYAWNIRTTYDKLWNLYGDEIVDCDFNEYNRIRPGFTGRLTGRKFDLAISTVPRTLWRESGDVFESQKVWALGDAPERGQACPFSPAQDFTVLCDGTDDVGWYRVSKVFGYTTIEWPYNRKPDGLPVSLVEKPLRHNSTAASDIIHLGRYGAWEKGVLTTHVFDQAMKILGEDKL